MIILNCACSESLIVDEYRVGRLSVIFSRPGQAVAGSHRTRFRFLRNASVNMRTHIMPRTGIARCENSGIAV